MNKTMIFSVGDKVQTQDGRLGVVIDTDRDPCHQGATTQQTIVVRFPDRSTTEGSAEKFTAVSSNPSNQVDS